MHDSGVVAAPHDVADFLQRRAVFLAASFFGAIVNADAIWSMGDIGYGLMAWANIIAIALLAPKASAMLEDYEQQKKEGKNPVFDPTKFGIED